VRAVHQTAATGCAPVEPLTPPSLALTALPFLTAPSCTEQPAPFSEHTPVILSCRGAPNLRRLTLVGSGWRYCGGQALLRFLQQPEEGSRARQLLEGVRELRLEVGWGVLGTVLLFTWRSCSACLDATCLPSALTVALTALTAVPKLCEHNHPSSRPSLPNLLLLQRCFIGSEQDKRSLVAALLARCPLACSLDLYSGLSNVCYRALAASNHVQELKLTGDSVQGSEMSITQMTALRSLRLPRKWSASFAGLQALAQLQHLSLGYMVNDSFDAGVLNAILRNCPLRSLVLGYIPCSPWFNGYIEFDLSAVDWAACSSTLVSLQLWREDRPGRLVALKLEGLPIAHAILPALKLLSVEKMVLTSPGDKLADIQLGFAAAVAASPDLRVEVDLLEIEDMRAAEVLGVLGPLGRSINVRRLECRRVVFKGPSEVAAVASLLPCRSLFVCRSCLNDATSPTALAFKAWGRREL